MNWVNATWNLMDRNNDTMVDIEEFEKAINTILVITDIEAIE